MTGRAARNMTSSTARLEDPLVSVIVPVYNVEPYLEECLASIRGQTYSRLEIIVIEDGSTDGSALVMERHHEDPRIRLLRHPRNLGLSAARNTGIDASTGDYLIFVDADDLIHPQLVELCLHCARAHDCDLVIFDAVAFSDRAPITVDRLGRPARCSERALPREEYFLSGKAAWRKLMRSSLLKSTDWRFPAGLCYEDDPLHYFLGLEAVERRTLDCALYFRRKRPNSITSSAGRPLLDWFATQRLSIPEVLARATRREQELFARVSYNTASRITLRIDREHLGAAIEAWRALDAEMRSHGLTAKLTWRSRVVAAVLDLPRPVSAQVLRILRASMTRSIWRRIRGTRM